MKKRIPKIHFITQEHPNKTHLDQAKEACRAGAELVQLRIKNESKSKIIDIALKIKNVCDYHGSKFIINDYIDIALETNADGVHLGNQDPSHELAREILGPDKIIGGTAYNSEELNFHNSNKLVDYIGLGNYRKSATKPEIKKFHSLASIKFLIDSLREKYENPIPLLVIGGIRKEDVKPLIRTGLYGIAISSLINDSTDKKKTFSQLRSFGLSGESGILNK